VGDGQGIQKVLAFSYLLAEYSNEKLSSTYWQETIERYFTHASQMKLTLWKDNEQAEAKVFEITKAIIPQFFLATMQSGVRSMSLGLDGARERLYSVGHSIVETTKAVWTCRYHNGYVVTLTGPLTVRVVVCSPSNPPSAGEQPNAILKFEQFQFDASTHEKFISVDSIQLTRSPELPKTPRSRNAPTPVPNGPPDDAVKRPWEEQRMYGDKASLPVEPVNAFGIPQATMRVLEVSSIYFAAEQRLIMLRVASGECHTDAGSCIILQ
ncbi:LIM-domain binding protein, partial [Pterulicium gracile]